LKKITLLLFLLLTTFAVQTVHAQEKKLVQFSGVILHADSLAPRPFVNIFNVSRGYKGTYSDFRGFFSLVVGVGDTIRIASLGFKKQEIIIPDNLINNSVSAIFKLKPESFNIPMVYIFPFATLEQFKQAFLKLKLADDDLMLAQKNLDEKVMNALKNSMAWDGSQNSKYFFQQSSEKLYWAGQNRYNPLFDIVKINQFIQLLNEGKINLKNEKKED
jgi:hypothetical protein